MLVLLVLDLGHGDGDRRGTLEAFSRVVAFTWADCVLSVLKPLNWRPGLAAPSAHASSILPVWYRRFPNDSGVSRHRICALTSDRCTIHVTILYKNP